MPCGREIRLRRVKSLRRWGFISFHLMRSGKYHNLQSKLFHRERSERFRFLLRLNALNIGRGACRGSEHRAACGRWSGAMSRKKQRALRRAPRPRWLHITRFRLWRKLIHYAPRPLPPKCEHFGIPPCKATMFLTVRIVGSSPTWGKNKKSCRKTGFLFCIIQYLSFVKCAWFQWNAPFRHFWKICFE